MTKKHFFFIHVLLLLFALFLFVHEKAFAFMDRATDCSSQSFSCFSNKYGFGSNPKPYTFSKSDTARMAEIKPYAIQAAQAYNSISGHDKVEPQMLVWWAIYDTGGSINYSNCNDQGTPTGTTYNTWITNCNNPWLWQLGYGAQFSHVATLKDGFTKLYGDPNNASLVQKIGQVILTFDKTIPTTPDCGGYSCTFPAMTIGQILSGTNSSGHNLTTLPEDNWWAAVLLRDPLLNAYNMADILTVDIINKDTICGWRGNYCSTWGGAMTNSLAQIVNTWNTIPNTGKSLAGNPGGNSPLGQDFLSQFSQSTGQYYGYYQFAKTNLFGGLDFVTNSTTGSTGNIVSDYALTLEAAILKSCPKQNTNLYGTSAVVNSSTKGCIQSAAFKSEIGQYANDVVNELVTSVDQNKNLQCVGFARAVAAGIGKKIGPNDQGQAGNPDYTWIPIGANKDIPGGVKIGDIAHFRDGVGHIGIITSIDPNHRGFGMTEANGNCLTVTSVDKNGHLYQHPDCTRYPAGRVDTTNPHNYIYDGNFNGVLRLN